MKKFSPPLSAYVLLASAFLSGCGALDAIKDERIDYKSSGKATGPSLEVPPDLTQLSRDTRYVVPGATVTASGYQSQVAAQPTIPTATISVGDVRIERSGNQRWLVINRPAEKLWEPVREFWQENGFLLAIDQENLGIMETDFAENRAKLPQDFIRNALGKVLDSLYSTGERDKFRTRLERTSADTTEIYISHRGMVETVVALSDNTKTGENTVWQPRPSDPELETEFLRRLMVKLGVAAEQSKALVASTAPKQTSRVITVNNTPVVQIDNDFERAWRRVGLTLDRTGFTVEDRDRAQGIYFVRYVEPVKDKKEAGFFSKLFGSATATPLPLKYRIAVRSQGEFTQVSILNEQGATETSANAQRIVELIANDLQ